MKAHNLEVEFWLPRPRADVFAFFADARHLDSITPAWLHFRTITPAPIKMQVGAIIDYKLRLHGMPVRWRTEITEWAPPYRFVDQQVHGPYREWIHTHSFEEKDGGTLVRDHVRYRVPGGWLEPLIHRLFVARDVAEIFRYRQMKIEELMNR
jgi:ligand-binding SRPBCC domain-containing protein